MKLKRFLLVLLIFCTLQMPSSVFGAKQTVNMTADGAVINYDSDTAAGGLAEQIFSFDDKLAPIKLEFVDFKIERNRTPEEWGKDIGRYNFKLFGCKRAEKNIVLNQGRAMRRDMKFDDVFFEQMNELFPVVVHKDSPYFPYSVGNVMPGYVITAEIKDLFVNVCDQYDWRTRTYSQLRSGSAEIKVLWRVMTPFNRKIYWEDTTYGYAEIQDPIRNGEVRLVEKAFADALVRVIGMPGFLETMQNKPDPSMLARAKAEFDAMAYQHIQARRNLMSSYRRRRMKFYNERERERILSDLEKLGPSSTTIGDGLEHGQGNARALSEIEELRAAGIPLTREEADMLRAAEKQAELILAEQIQAEREEKDLAALGGEGIYARLLKDMPLEQGVYGRLLDSTPLARLFDGFLLPIGLDRTDGKFGFTVSPEDGWITINNNKPFRYLSPTRLYRIRSSVVAVTNEEDVGSGLVIAPSLVLTNYEIAKKSPYVKVEFLDGRVSSAMVLRGNKEKDVALLYMPPAEFDRYNWPIPLRIDLPEVGEEFYAIGTPMRGGFEGAMEFGKVAGYRYSGAGVDILTNTNVQSVTLGGVLVDENGNAVGLAHAGDSLIESRDGFIPIGDAFDALRVRIRDREMEETPTQKALRLKKMRDDYIK